MKEDIQNEIKRLLNDNRDIADTDSLVTSGLLSSLQIVEIASWLELKYGVDFGKHGFNIYHFETVLTIMDLIQHHKK
jgi:acyl carrier protein